MKKLVLDVMGTDNPTIELLKGVEDALREIDDIYLYLVGKKEILDAYFEGKKYANLEFIYAEEEIKIDKNPLVTAKTNKEASIIKGLIRVRDDAELPCFISCGNTATLCVGSMIYLKKCTGFMPLLASILQNEEGYFTLADCGLNINATSTDLVSYAKVSSAFMSAYMGIESPRVGLLSNGAEPTKGTKVIVEAHEMLKNENLNFVGNIEANHVMDGGFDCLVSDGFSANLILKNIEGTALAIAKMIEGLDYLEIKEEDLEKVANHIRSRYDFNSLGAAFLLGFDKLVVKGHGHANRTSIVNIIKQAVKLLDGKVCEKLANI